MAGEVNMSLWQCAEWPNNNNNSNIKTVEGRVGQILFCYTTQHLLGMAITRHIKVECLVPLY